MAMAYSGAGTHPMMRMKGLDFIEDLRRMNQDVQIVMLDHDDVADYERILHQYVQDPESVEGFFRNRMRSVDDVSLRELRKAAEIVVFLPEGQNHIPFKRKHIDIRTAKTKDGHAVAAGKFHTTQVNVARTISGEMKHLRKRRSEYTTEIDNITKRMQYLVTRIQRLHASTHPLMYYHDHTNDTSSHGFYQYKQAVNREIAELDRELQALHNEYDQLVQHRDNLYRPTRGYSHDQDFSKNRRELNQTAIDESFDGGMVGEYPELQSARAVFGWDRDRDFDFTDEDF